MSYENAPATRLVATRCASCNRPLVDAESVEIGLGPDCRRMYGFNIPIEPQLREIANGIVHDIARGALKGAALKEAVRELSALGFDELADRIAERLAVYTPPPEAPPAAVISIESQREIHQEEIPTPQPEPQKSAAPEDRPITLTEGQDRALRAVQRIHKEMGARVVFITGFAGTGKTTLLREIARSCGTPIVITPTGKAALRVREATGLRASTIHRWLYAPKEDVETGAVRFVKRYPDEVDSPPSRLVLLDEASMVGPELWRDVWDMCCQKALHLVCVGDGFQLPPVMPGRQEPFSVLLPAFAASLKADRIELTEILRQAMDSPVVRASMQLREGGGLRALHELPRIRPDQFYLTAARTHTSGGVTICHRNTTRARINAGVRTLVGHQGAPPLQGEPLLVLKNTYEVGLVNGESFEFPGWHRAPDEPERVFDRWRGIEEIAHFGAVVVDERKMPDGRIVRSMATLAVEELYGSLTAAMRAIADAGSRWAKGHDLYLGNNPLPHVHVNLGYAYTAHKCVHPRTLVETPIGLLRMEELAPEGIIATAVGPRSYGTVVRRRRGKMLRIRTKDGYALDVTPDHGVYVWNGSDYARVLACDVKPGSFVRLRLGAQCDPKNLVELPDAPPADVRATTHQIPSRLTEDVAELFGLLVADGVVAPKVIRLAKRHRDVVQRFATLCARVFGVRLRVRPRYNRSKAWYAELRSTQVSGWLRAIGGMSPHAKDVPACVRRSRLSVQAAFLRGLFEDGGVNLKDGAVDHIEWSNKSEDVAQTVQTMLLRFGIISSRRVRTRRPFSQAFLYIYGEHVKAFRRLIGFVSAAKRRRCARRCAKNTRNAAPWTRDEVWPHLSQFGRNNFRRAGTLSRDHMTALRKRTHDAAFRRALDEKRSWHHTRVTSVEAVSSAPSMCVNVPRVHRFLQNGFDGSNSQGSEWPYVLVVLEPSIRFDREEGRRWAYTALTRATKMAAYYVGNVG